jgi:hypothetical protein
MAVCINFNFPRVAATTLTGPAVLDCGGKYGTTVGAASGGGFTPLPFKAYQLLRPANGLTTPTGRSVDALPSAIGSPLGWPHFVKGVIVPGAAGDAGCGVYALFGRIP